MLGASDARKWNTSESTSGGGSFFLFLSKDGQLYMLRDI